jgi:hypothetical protein
MAIHYVDSSAGGGGDGSIGSPWNSITQVNAHAFAADDFCLFNRGQTFAGTINPSASGTAGHQITYGAYGTGALPIIDGSGLTNCLTTPSVKAQYITCEYLHFYNSTQWGVYVNHYDGSGHVLSTPGWLVKNCTFTACGCALVGPGAYCQDCTFIGPPNYTGDQAAIYFQQMVSTDCYALRNTIDDWYSRGIWFMGVSGACTANDNVIDNISYTVGTSTEGYGINFDGYASPITGLVTASGNRVSNCARNGIETENCSVGVVFTRNIVSNCASGGLHCMNYPAKSAAPPFAAYGEQRGASIGATLSYNVIYSCLYGITLQNVSGVNVWNNVIYDDSATSSAAIYIADFGAAPPYYVADIDFQNNIVAGTTMSKVCTMRQAWEQHFTAFDYNAVVSSVFNQFYPTPAVNHTLTALQAEAWGLNCFTTDPAFTNAATRDFTLGASSPCIDTGVNVGLTTDILGNALVGVPDIGAYEYGSGLPVLLIRVHGRK